MSSFESDHFSDELTQPTHLEIHKIVQHLEGSQMCNEISKQRSKKLSSIYSAGVGRTGVFISLSIVLERMQYEGVVDVFQTVRTLRTQRPAMVQTEDQYQFCYRAALEYLSSFDHYTDN